MLGSSKQQNAFTEEVEHPAQQDEMEFAQADAEDDEIRIAADFPLIRVDLGRYALINYIYLLPLSV